MKKILFIVGSQRKESFNLNLAKKAESLLEGKAEVSYLDYKDVPFLNQDEEYPTPGSVASVRKAVESADGVWIFTPEYNHSYPGVLKNVIDWLSRPAVAYDFETPTVIRGKKVAVSGAGGNAATAAARLKLAELLTFIGAEVMDTPQTGVVLNNEAWTEGRMILSDGDIKALEAEAEALLAFIN